MTSMPPALHKSAPYLISIVIITHNRQHEVVRAVRSAYAQSAPALEIIVVDDGSSPQVVLGDLAEPSGPPLRLIRNDKPVGPSGARNRGVNAASGEWIAFLDDDDQFEVDKLEVIGRHLCQLDLHTDVIYHPARIMMLNEGVQYVSSPPVPPDDESLFRGLLVKNIVGGTPMVVARKSALKSVGLFDESLRALEDYELWLRMAKAGCRFRFIAAPLTRYSCVTAKPTVTQSDAAGIKTFRHIRSTYTEEFAALTPKERQDHMMWIHEVELQREILRLDYLGTLKSSLRLLQKFPRLKYLMAFLASLLGPKTVIYIRARMSA
jgi:glycosyltransferase involved in cell wall biosynthesis